MRVCFISRRFWPAVSGMSVYASNLLRELARGGHDVTMISQYRDDAAGKGVYGGGPPPEVHGVRVIGLESIGEQRGGDFELDIQRMVETVEAEHETEPFDIIHAQYGYPTGLAALEAGRRLGVPNVVSIQGGDGHWVGKCCGTHKRAMRAVLDHAGAVLIGSQSFAAEVVENHGVSTERFTIIPGAADTKRFYPADGTNGTLPEVPTLLYHGRVDARKGALDLLDAVAELLEHRPLRLIVSGIGPDSNSAAERAGDLGISEHVEFSGYADYEKAPEVYRRGDVFLSPTYAEGFSNTILEAMATGLPIVSTRAVGVVDCLADGENGLLVEPGDIPGLVAATARLLDDAELRRKLSSQALSDVRRLYAWPVVAEEITAVYTSLLGTRPDKNWSDPGPVEPCRFRETPHLL